MLSAEHFGVSNLICLLLEGRVLVVCVFDFFFFFCCKSPLLLLLLREALDLQELDLGNGLCLIRRSVFSG
jgi:hypothetical protein